MQFNVYIHEPLTGTGWETVERNVTLAEAENLARSWGAKGWRVCIISAECAEESWDFTLPSPA